MKRLAILVGLMLSCPAQAMTAQEALESYRGLCADLSSYRAVEQRARAIGWEAFEPAADSPQARYGNPENRGFRNVPAKQTFRLTTDNGPAYLFLMLARQRDGIGSGVHCKMQFPAIDSMPSLEFIASFMNREVGEVESTHTTFGHENSYAFFPGLGEGIEQTNISIVGPQSVFASEGTGLNIWSIDKQGTLE